MNKPQATRTMLLDICYDDHTEVLVLPVLDFSVKEYDSLKTLSIMNPSINCPKMNNFQRLKGVVFTITDDPNTRNAGHSIGLGYWNFRLVMHKPTYRVTKTHLEFTSDNLGSTHMRSDR